jgi:hypothetical protein
LRHVLHAGLARTRCTKCHRRQSGSCCAPPHSSSFFVACPLLWTPALVMAPQRRVLTSQNFPIISKTANVLSSATVICTFSPAPQRANVRKACGVCPKAASPCKVRTAACACNVTSPRMNRVSGASAQYASPNVRFGPRTGLGC